MQIPPSPARLARVWKSSIRVWWIHKRVLHQFEHCISTATFFFFLNKESKLMQQNQSYHLFLLHTRGNFLRLCAAPCRTAKVFIHLLPPDSEVLLLGFLPHRLPLAVCEKSVRTCDRPVRGLPLLSPNVSWVRWREVLHMWLWFEPTLLLCMCQSPCMCVKSL